MRKRCAVQVDRKRSVGLVSLIKVTPDQIRAARALLRFGKGRHRARLDPGDCASYALARSRGLPLLFKGHDFTWTDLVPAA